VRKVQVSDPNRLYRLRKLNSAKVQAFSDTASSTLLKYVKAFPTVEALHPFYRELVDIGIGVDELRIALARVQGAAETLSSIGRRKAREIMRMQSQEEMMAAQREALGRMTSVLRKAREPLEVLSRAREYFRSLPEIDPEIPTVIVAGYPNVGKSQLTRALSTAKPEVSSYPFTTKGVTVGVFEVGRRRIQVVDTPGLLDRAPERRNEIERKAAAALKHLGGIVLYLIDPTERCGYPVEEQISLLQKLAGEFPWMRFFVVATKSDLMEGKFDDKLGELGIDGERLLGVGVVSAVSGEGIEELKNALGHLLL